MKLTILIYSVQTNSVLMAKNSVKGARMTIVSFKYLDLKECVKGFKV